MNILLWSEQEKLMNSLKIFNGSLDKKASFFKICCIALGDENCRLLISKLYRIRHKKSLNPLDLSF